MQVKFVGERQKKTLHPVLKSYLCGYLSSAAFVTAPTSVFILSFILQASQMVQFLT